MSTDATLVHTIATTIHGRYLVRPAAGEGPAPLLVGFHGYAEAAEHQMPRLASMAGSEHWTIVCVQALNRFYRGRTETVVAGWMTSQDRLLAIDDTLAYLEAVVAEVARQHPLTGSTVYAGFSQGASVAFRAAARLTRRSIGVIAVGGDLPPELDAETLTAVPSVLLVRPVEDNWYTPDKFEADQARLVAAGVDVRALEVAGGHDWTAETKAAAAAYLAERR